MERVQQASPRAWCHQVADQLRTAIEAGLFEPGDKLPAPRELARECGVKPDTARSAIRVLQHEGLVELVPRAGAIVLAGAPMRDVELPPGATVSAFLPADPERRELGLPVGVPLLVVEVVDDGEHTIRQYPAHETRLTCSQPRQPVGQQPAQLRWAKASA